MHRQTKYDRAHKADKKIYYQTNKARMRDTRYQRTFGITLQKYNEMFLIQNGLCLGCYKHQKDIKYAFAVDHNHVTGKIRGLLCGNCNVTLGNAKDNPVILRRLADYLEAQGTI